MDASGQEHSNRMDEIASIHGAIKSIEPKPDLSNPHDLASPDLLPTLSSCSPRDDDISYLEGITYLDKMRHQERSRIMNKVYSIHEAIEAINPERDSSDPLQCMALSLRLSESLSNAFLPLTMTVLVWSSSGIWVVACFLSFRTKSRTRVSF
jgi:hypothetical protein